MIKVSAFTLANDVINFPTGEGKNIPALIGPQPILRPKYIPGLFSFAFSISIHGLDSDKDTDLKMEIFDPEGKKVQNAAAITLSAAALEDKAVPAEHKSATINVSVRNFPLEKEGVYCLIPYVNGTALDTQLIPVFKEQEKKQLV